MRSAVCIVPQREHGVGSFVEGIAIAVAVLGEPLRPFVIVA